MKSTLKSLWIKKNNKESCGGFFVFVYGATYEMTEITFWQLWNYLTSMDKQQHYPPAREKKAVF